MKQNIILYNFKPVLVGKLFDQKKLNKYTKFLYYHLQNKTCLSVAGDNNSTVDYEFVSHQVDKYAISPENINQRQTLLFDEIEQFIENKMEDASINDYQLPNNLVNSLSDLGIAKIGSRMQWFKEKMGYVFDEFYSKTTIAPENLLHVTCSGYASPSVAQEAVIKRNWQTSQVTHSYQMGCYGAFPAIRTASSLVKSSTNNGRVDVVHTELLSSHLNLTELSASNIMICSLFGDGFIGYSLQEEYSFMNDDSIEEKKGLRILASHEVIIPDSLEDMSWDLGEYSFLMTLSKRVPVFIRKNIESFLTTLCNKADINLEEEKSNMYFAIHPGGPKIIDYVIDEIGVLKEQAHSSYEILRRQGNMSSATIPHIFNEIINDSKLKSGTKIVAMAFGPGLTATALLVEKI
ncbi:3-oxoacyl-[acyl-carrier-protein] synthase III C-terminal domain-containing protein [Flavobacterium sp. MDT1-60]|uniref:3-oxoacyl-[acyl-carrier-protein] synthase III C-terminal domain-containing protein n=1 Tax=Flavobacterium sp. MDT1-60 TaxID=1979344 RepID=UPI00177BD066|nr:3-oxoacyl-[acyl-carrier-protein] synthase III C-terminal domain-containing protein [Flavobacterium sp. MDT1-60]QOG01815.1 hypothetical protein IHE43_18730 [Flavobacterium sp. MDT1-60]